MRVILPYRDKMHENFLFQLELQHLKFLSQPPTKKTYAEIIERFNANVPYSGLLHSVTQDVSDTGFVMESNLD